jgi:hypothetical protein
MIQKYFPCTCSSSIERYRCKESCDNEIKRVWVEEKWIVFREFDSEEEARAFAHGDIRRVIQVLDWKIEKR